MLNHDNRQNTKRKLKLCGQASASCQVKRTISFINRLQKNKNK